MNDFNIDSYKRLHKGDCPNCETLQASLVCSEGLLEVKKAECKKLQVELDKKDEILRLRHILEETQTEVIRKLQAELALLKKWEQGYLSELADYAKEVVGLRGKG